MGGPTFDDYVIIGRIYSGKTESDVRQEAARCQRGDKARTLEYGLLSYLRRELHVPTEFTPEILQLGRRLQPLEVEALFLRSKVQEAGVTGISITIDGLVQPKL